MGLAQKMGTNAHVNILVAQATDSEIEIHLHEVHQVHSVADHYRAPKRKKDGMEGRDRLSWLH